MDEPRLTKWLSRLPGPQISHLKLCFLSIAEAECIRTWEMASLGGQTEKALALDILETADDDCDGREAQCRYSVRAVNDKEEIVMQKVILSRPKGSTDPKGVGDASLQGIVAQTLRHNEALMRMHIGSMSGIMSAQNQIMQMQSDQIRGMKRREKAHEDDKGEDNDDIEKMARANTIVRIGEAVADELIPIAAKKLKDIAN